MAENIKVGWLTDKNGDKFAPKTLISQVQTNDGTLLADEIANIVNAKVDKIDIATTVMQGTAVQNNTYWKISNFGNWGTGTWMQKGFTMLITSRAGEMVWVSLAANDSNTSAGAIRLINRYSKINALHYSVSESAIYVTAVGWANNICAHILSNVNGDYVPTIAAATGLPSDAVKINIVEFGINSTSTVVGNSSVALEMGGSADRPTYNGSNMALQSDITSRKVNGKALSSDISLAASDVGAAPSSHDHDNIVNGTVGIRASNDNEVNFKSNVNYIYFGYDNRMNSSALVDTYIFGKHAGGASSADGNIECGSLIAGRTLKGGTVTVGNVVTLQYDTTNECLNFTFT